MKKGWAWCFKCEGLFYIDTEWLSFCPAGGAHDESFAGSFLYSINTENKGEAHWRRCTRCQGLFRRRGGIGLVFFGECPAPGTGFFEKSHSPDEAVHYFVEINNLKDQTLQQGWRHCRKCLSMFYSGHATQGNCPTGDRHDAGDSPNYSLFVE